MLRTVPLGTEYLLPPVEIGGYKYSVPNGTARLRSISNLF